ncbi:MAG: hypothetical protein LKI25_02235 [Atopobiaceae bacterium]|jgi:hypothetical protein|nr:hypothetical protein [Atopobiaceae bacterium]MCI2173025.1 hypothetical protein [Atopobiaceae bacterium]MCI2208118.1 hypothetical protein [Atopobiaceae bacterium]
MERLIKVFGDADGNLNVSVDNGDPVTMAKNEDIQADKVYQSLRYRAGDSYSLEKGDRGAIDERPFNLFFSFFEAVVEEVNEHSSDRTSPLRIDEEAQCLDQPFEDDAIPF